MSLPPSLKEVASNQFSLVDHSEYGVVSLDQ